MDDDKVLKELRSLGEHLRREVSVERSRQVSMSALATQRRRRSVRWVPAVVVASFFLVGNVALAETSDGAIPGDLLYPVDRAYEWLADLVVASDHTPERVDEALTLVGKGQTALALQAVEEILGGHAELGIANLAGSANSADVREKVKDLVAAAAQVSEAAQSGDQTALQNAIEVVHQEAAEVAAEAGNNQDSGSDNPSVTAPGQVDPPSVTAPGQVEEEPSTTTSHPGQGQGGGQGSTNGQGQSGRQP